MLIQVKNKRDAVLNNEMKVPHVIISISTPLDEVPLPAVNEHTLEVLSLRFHDLDKDPGPIFKEVYGEPVLFTLEMAVQIKELLDTHNPEGVVVHCDAGQSRSAGVAAALALHYNGSDTEFWGSGMYGRRYSPNRMVCSLVTAALTGSYKS